MPLSTVVTCTPDLPLPCTLTEITPKFRALSRWTEHSKWDQRACAVIWKSTNGAAITDRGYVKMKRPSLTSAVPLVSYPECCSTFSLSLRSVLNFSGLGSSGAACQDTFWTDQLLGSSPLCIGRYHTLNALSYKLSLTSVAVSRAVSFEYIFTC